MYPLRIEYQDGETLVVPNADLTENTQGCYETYCTL
jgi:hypothetical protein